MSAENKFNQIPEAFASIANETGSVWLDSTMHFDDRGRFSYVARNPVSELILLPKGRTCLPSAPRSILLNDSRLFLNHLEQLSKDDNLFLTGYISYEAMTSFVGVQPKQVDTRFPLAHFYVYQSVLRYDHLTGEIDVTNSGIDDYHDLLADHGIEMFEPLETDPSDFKLLPYPEYKKQIEKIKYHIHEGDIYQANYTTRIEVTAETDPYRVYKALRRNNPGGYNCFMQFGNYQILSSSPERLFLKEQDHITSSPIKGTIARGDNADETAENIQKLLASDKDKAELLMIVDLVRNDLGKIAKTGSVKVEELFKPELYSSLIHLVGDVSAEISPENNLASIIESLCPGGSITGAPKKRAVELINQYETDPRFVYTGSIGYIRDGRADFNIAIRTMYHHDNRYYIHAGGGIVADSDPEAEYNELLLKAQRLLQLFGIEHAGQTV